MQNTTNFLTKIKNFYQFAELSTENIKADEKSKNLEVINILINKFVAKAVKVIYDGRFVSKFDIAKLQDISNGKVDKQYGKYGHIIVDSNKNIRVSTCLNLKYGGVQIPMSEEKYWNKNTDIFFTNGDMFLIINSEDLKHINHSQTKLKNYSYDFNSIFGYCDPVVGLYKDKSISYCTKETFKEVDLSDLQLSEKFYKFKSRGCVSTLKPKYFVLERNQNIDFDEHGSTFKSLKAIEDNYNFNVSRQYLGRIASRNAEIIDRLQDDNESKIFSLLKKIKIDKKSFYIISIDDLEDTLKKIKRVLLKKKDDYNNELDKKCSLKKAIFYIKKVRSSEEYFYYKNKIIKQVGENPTLRDCIFLKEMNQIPEFEYSDSKIYNFYKNGKN